MEERSPEEQAKWIMKVSSAKKIGAYYRSVAYHLEHDFTQEELAHALAVTWAYGESLETGENNG